MLFYVLSEGADFLNAGVKIELQPGIVLFFCCFFLVRLPKWHNRL